MKKLYRGIVSSETKFLSEKIVEDDPEEGRILLEERGKDLPDEDVEVHKCNKLSGSQAVSILLILVSMIKF